MSDEKEVVDRGDEYTASDESGDTDDQNLEVVKDEKTGDDAEAESDVKESNKPAADADAEEDDENEAEEKGAKKEEPRIPKHRFDQAVAKARKEAEIAQAKVEELTEQLAAQEGKVDFDKIEAEIDRMEDELEEAIKDGNTETKLRLRKEIRRSNQEIAESKAAQHAARATAVAIERITYDSLVKSMEIEHPELNPDAEEYNQDLVDETQEFKEAFEAKGHGSTEALRKAMKAVFRVAPVVEKDDDAADEKKPEVKKDVGADRKEEAIKKGIETKKKQPVDSKKAGLDSDKAGKKTTITDVKKLTEAEFDKLPEEELKRMRGDML